MADRWSCLYKRRSHRSTSHCQLIYTRNCWMTLTHTCAEGGRLHCYCRDRHLECLQEVRVMTRDTADRRRGRYPVPVTQMNWPTESLHFIPSGQTSSPVSVSHSSVTSTSNSRLRFKQSSCIANSELSYLRNKVPDSSEHRLDQVGMTSKEIRNIYEALNVQHGG